MRRRILRLVHEHLADALIVLLAAVAVLSAVVLVEELSTDSDRLDELATVLDVSTTVLGGVLLIAGAVVGYRRYLKGRVFAQRLQLTLRCAPVRWMEPADGGDRQLLHSLDVEAENIGDSTVWEPDVSVQIRGIDSEDPLIDAPVVESIAGPRPELGLAGIEPGETVAFHVRFRLPAHEPVFRVSVELRSSGGVWHRAATLPNCFDPAREIPGETPPPSPPGGHPASPIPF